MTLTEASEQKSQKKFDVKKLGHIGVLMGGASSEREISLRSGKAVFTALKESGCHVDEIDIASTNQAEVLALLKKSQMDVAFIALHGEFGEDGWIQAILEKAKIPYVGSSVGASRVAIDKVLTQKMLKKNGVPSADFIVVKKNKSLSSEEIVKRI